MEFVTNFWGNYNQWWYYGPIDVRNDGYINIHVGLQEMWYLFIYELLSSYHGVKFEVLEAEIAIVTMPSKVDDDYLWF